MSTGRQVTWLIVVAGLALAAGLTAGAAALNARQGSLAAARAALALAAGAALAAGLSLVIDSTQPAARGSDCSVYVQHGELPVGLLLAATALGPVACFAIARTGRTMGRAALAMGSAEIVLFMVGMLYIASANPSC